MNLYINTIQTNEQYIIIEWRQNLLNEDKSLHKAIFFSVVFETRLFIGVSHGKRSVPDIYDKDGGEYHRQKTYSIWSSHFSSLAFYRLENVYFASFELKFR